MTQLQSLIKKASDYPFYKWLLNRIMAFTVPFNGPHKFKILEISPGKSKILLPYRRSNLNHVKGIHACALATLCEYTIGLTLVSKIGEKEFRIILKNLDLEYHYQAKMDVIASFELNDEMLSEQIILPMQKTDAVFCKFEVSIFDLANNHICTGHTNWQVKKWEKVKSQ
jgi:acyl-coenzyme A thioesterase PaaI-like protein